ncbi:MAG: winged helix-turn-helix transcriptional regulator, partial [Bryobacterales bacterium]|nr:winged helix-turn-helix transcriptional regulator [Bryobacterales bacterium]
MPKKDDSELIARYADMLSAMGTEPRLRIVRLLLSAHPAGMVVGEVSEELGIPSSTLSHHLEKLKNEDLVRLRREGTYLWYSANTEACGSEGAAAAGPRQRGFHRRGPSLLR